jgi:SAM-dependent methyltransferase
MRTGASLQGPVLAVQRYVDGHFDRFDRAPYLLGRCNVCASYTAFFCPNKALYRESLVCAVCLTTSRYRSIARGILRAIAELRAIRCESLAELDPRVAVERLRIYDTQAPSYWRTGAYPIPDLLARCPWIDVQTSVYRRNEAPGARVGPHTTTQTLEQLTFPSASFDVVVTSDVMEHVRLDDRAHREISRVLRPGGVYLFTVPHDRVTRETFVRVQVVDPDDPSKDRYLTEKEYHRDTNAEAGGALSYRSYGTDLDATLAALGFDVEYGNQDYPESCIMNTELFYCRKGMGGGRS